MGHIQFKEGIFAPQLKVGKEHEDFFLGVMRFLSIGCIGILRGQALFLMGFYKQGIRSNLPCICTCLPCVYIVYM